MNQEVRTMLEKTYETFKSRFGHQTESWDKFIEFIATDNCPYIMRVMNHNFEWLFQDKLLTDELLKVYDGRLLRSDFYDHLGEMYKEKVLSKNKPNKNDLFLESKSLADRMTKLPENMKNRPINILDQAVGTGRLLMAAYNKSKDSLLFGVDSDIRLIRISLTNFAIFDIPGYLLHANRNKHEIDIAKEDGRYNWTYANRWYSQMDKLKPSC